jgi:outer membrane autotransporter protein
MPRWPTLSRTLPIRAFGRPAAKRAQAFALRALAAAVLACFGSSAYAQTATASGNWSSTATWDTGTVPDSFTATATLDKPSGLPMTVTVDGTFDLLGLVITGSNISGGPGVGGGTLNFAGAGAFITVGTANLETIVILPTMFNFTGSTTVTLNNSRQFILRTGSTIQGTGSTTVAGNGTLLVTGSVQTTGATTVSAGATLQIGSGLVQGSISTDIVNNGSVVFNQANAYAYGGAISGTGGLTQTSSTLTLSGANTYTGGTTINGGTLAISADNNLGAAAGGLTFGGGTLRYDGSFTSARSVTLNAGGGTFDTNGNAATLSGVISGTGALSKAGAGVLTSSGANTYTGGTTINAGTLAISADNNLGAAAGGLTFGGGTLRYDGSLASNRSVTLNAGGGTFDTNGNAATLSGAISGTGALSKAGAGTLTLTGANTYGGTTTISGGTLQIGAGGAGGTLGTGAVTNNAALAFNRFGTHTVANAIGGTGTLTQAGNGALTLTGANTYSGTTTISNGTLQIGDGGTTGTLGTGAVTTDSILRFNRSDALTVANAIGGTGVLLKFGSGTLTLTGANTYAGGTGINGGTLQVGAGGTTGTLGTGTVTNNAALAFNRSDALSVANAIGGTGTLTQSGTGTLTLSGANTYSGGTSINGGTLAIAADNNLGGAAGGLTFGGGTLRYDGSFTSGRSVTLNAGGGTFDTNGSGATLSGVISGAGALSKAGAGILTPSGANTYTGGTTINAGTLAISADNNLGDAAGGLTFGGGTLRFDAGLSSARSAMLNAGGGTFHTNGNAVTLSGAISGAGALSKVSAGTLTLTGANAYSGNTTIDAGTLQVGDGGTTGTLGTGAVTNNAALAFNRSDALSVANAISGTGTLTQAGAGTLTLTGASTYSGATAVNAGTLAVNGSITSAITVNNGGTLGGSGSAGNVTVMSGGALAPGNSIGTMTVNGSLTFQAGSVFRVETDSAGNADRINVVGAPGTITINGGTVDVQAGAGTYARNTQYTILTSNGATTGEFTSVTSNLAFLTPSLVYQPNSVLLNLTSSATASYSSVATTTNQANVASYLNSFANNPGDASAASLIQQIDNLSAPQAQVAFDGLSGSAYAGASQIAGAIGRTLSAALMGRADAGGAAGDSRAAFRGVQVARLDVDPTASDAPFQVAQAGGAPRKARAGEAGFWGQALGTGGSIDSDGNGPESSYRAAGLMAGYDVMASPRWLLGAALGYTASHWDADVNGASRSSGRIETPQAALYARYGTGPWALRLNAGYADHKFSTTRDVTIGATTSRHASTHHGRELSAGAEIEYSMPMGTWELRPLAGLRYANLREKAFTESGSATTALTMNARTTESVNASAGARLLRPFADGSGGWEFRAALSHLFGDRDSPVSARLVGQPASFAANGTPLKRTALNLGAGVAGTLKKNVTGFTEVSYEARGSGQDAYAVTAGLRVVW